MCQDNNILESGVLSSYSCILLTNIWGLSIISSDIVVIYGYLYVNLDSRIGVPGGRNPRLKINNTVLSEEKRFKKRGAL
jgi:hypothetical protein